MPHLEEETIAQHAAGLLAADARRAADEHVPSCPFCRSRLAAYEKMVAALTSPPVPAGLVARVQEQIHQRLRVKQFVQRLIEDPAWRVEVQRDPHLALERHRIHPTPQLVAALRQISSLQEEVDGSQLDERISKLLPPM